MLTKKRMKISMNFKIHFKTYDFLPYLLHYVKNQIQNLPSMIDFFLPPIIEVTFQKTRFFYVVIFLEKIYFLNIIQFTS